MIDGHRPVRTIAGSGELADRTRPAAYSARLFLTEQIRAGLNLYASRPGAFTDLPSDRCDVSPSSPRLALLAAARQDTANHLTRVGNQPGDRGGDGHPDG